MEVRRRAIWAARPFLRRPGSRIVDLRFFSHRTSPICMLQQYPLSPPRTLQRIFARQDHTASKPTGPVPISLNAPVVQNLSQQETPGSNPAEQNLSRQEVPSYELTFTCKPCKNRSTHRISRKGYHRGTIMITCPDCKNRHIISDHLKIFMDEPVNLEDLIRDKGELIKRGSLGLDGDVEFWDDENQTKETRPERLAAKQPTMKEPAAKVEAATQQQQQQLL